MTFDHDLLIWISIGIIFFSRTIYLPILKPLRQSVVELSTAQFLQTYRPTCAKQIMPSSKGGGGIKILVGVFSSPKKIKFKPVWQARVGTFQIFYTVTNILEIFSGPSNISLARIYVPLIFSGRLHVVLFVCLHLLQWYLYTYLGTAFYLFVSHSGMNDRGSTCKFRKAQSDFRNLHVDPLSFITLWETNK